VDNIKTEDAKVRDIQHPSFDKARKNEIWQIKYHLDLVYKVSAEGWEDQFRRDADPEQEIQTWIRVGTIFTEVCEIYPLSKDQRQEIFQILFKCTLTNREEAMKMLKGTKVLPKEQAELAIRKYYGT